MTHSEHPLGSVIRQYRKERGLTQIQLSEKADISHRQVMSIEKGKCYPKFETLCSLVQTLNIPADHIFYPDIEDNDLLLNSFIALYRSCHPEDQALVVSTMKTLVEQLMYRHQKSTNE